MRPPKERLWIEKRRGPTHKSWDPNSKISRREGRKLQRRLKGCDQ